MPKPSKTEINRERLLNEGVTLFSEHGFHGIGLKDILATVNIPKGSFYHYFESKEDFGAKVVEYYTELAQERLAGAFGEVGLAVFIRAGCHGLVQGASQAKFHIL